MAAFWSQAYEVVGLFSDFQRLQDFSPHCHCNRGKRYTKYIYSIKLGTHCENEQSKYLGDYSGLGRDFDSF